MSPTTDILIIGGGISGLLTARTLRLAGRGVTVIDQAGIGQESSWAGGGILLPIYPWRQDPAISDLVLASLKIYPTLSQELLAATGIDPEWTACGMLICQNPDIDAAMTWCIEREMRYQAAPLERLQGLNTEPLHPLWLPEIAQVRNPRLLKSLKAYLTSQDVRFIEHASITHIEFKAGHIDHIQVNDTRLSADQVVLCAGAWSSDFLQHWLPESNWPLTIQPVRGQMLVFDTPANTLPHMVLDGDQYLIPRRDGKILAGSTVEAVGFNKVTTEQARQQLHDFATRLLPELKHHPVSHHWAGLRPGTPRGIPYIGRHPDIDNLSINAGHFRNGLVMGPASAQLITDLLLQHPPSINPAAYGFDRPH